jgi:O-antigen ligase
LLFAFVVVLQVVPLPSRFAITLSRGREWDIGLASQLGGKRSLMTLSIYPHATVMALVTFLAYLSGFLLAAHVFDSGKRKSLIVRALVFLGCFEAVYGIVQYLTGWQKIFTFTKQYNIGDATGTYINRNHFAGLLELTLPFVIASIYYAFQIWSESRSHGLGGRASRREQSWGFQAIVYLFLLVIMVLAVLFSHSRMGILTTIFSIVFVALVAQLRIRQRIWALGLILFLVCVSGYALWIGINPVLARFEQMREQGSLRLGDRVAFWKDEIRLVRQYPMLGTGLGTFGQSFRRYQTSFVEGFVDHAHNDYLEFASETGVLGAALLFLPILYLLARMMISFRGDPRRYRRSVTLGCTGSTLAILIHSVTDFNLQIPANALVFAVVLGIGYKASCVEPQIEAQTSSPLEKAVAG